MVIQGNKGIFDHVSAISSKRASPYPIFSIPHPPHLSTSSTLAHAPSILTSPVPEPPAKHPIYRSKFCLMRVTVKPANPCAATASSHCRQGFSRLEGLRRRYHLPASHLQGAAGEHRAVPQRGKAHAGSPALNFGDLTFPGLHHRSHFQADLSRSVRSGLYH